MKKILIADDEPMLQKILADTLDGFNKTIVCAADGEEALWLLTTGQFDLAFLDIHMPKMSGLEVLAKRRDLFPQTTVIVMTAQDCMTSAIEAMKLGAFDYLAKPLDLDSVAAIAKAALKNVNTKATNQGFAGSNIENAMISQCEAMREVYKIIGKTAPQNVTVLILGESGTGKELVAQAVHQYSLRSKKPFVAVNCAAIPHDILESELFGHRKGSFTGAIEDKKGYFEQADTGTIFLDEISEMPAALQSKLLRFLQNGVLQKIGASETKTVDVRVIAATNRDLKAEIQKGRFRDDLFFRLNVVPILIPPLRERREDIPGLIRHFVLKHSQNLGTPVKSLSPDAISYLCHRAWPGNVRELENAIVRLLVLSRNHEITLAETEAMLDNNQKPKQKRMEDFIANELSPLIEGTEAPRNLLDRCLPWVEKPLIQAALKRVGGNQLAAAEILGINRNTLRKKIKELGIYEH